MSSPRRPSRAAGGARKPSTSAERAELLRGLSLNAQTLTVIVMVIIGGIILSPQVKTWVEQRQTIADLQSQLQKEKDSLKQMQVLRNRWNDPAFVRAQARNRLFYVMPGEVSYIIMDADKVDSTDTTTTVGDVLNSKNNYTDITDSIGATKNDWMGALSESVIRAGVETPAEVKK